MATFSEAQILEMLTTGGNVWPTTRSDRMARVVWLRVGEQKTYREIGDELGVIPERSRQLYWNSVHQLRLWVRDGDPCRPRIEFVMATFPLKLLEDLFGAPLAVDCWRTMVGGDGEAANAI